MAKGLEREKELLSEALEMPTAQARYAFLKRACGPDGEMAQRLDGLLRAHDSAEGFLPYLGEDDTPGLDEPLTESPGAVIGRYKLLQKLGEGGMGVVYMAEQTEPVHRQVALKIIKLGMDTRQVVARFEAERQALALMDHPNIAKVLDAGATESGRPYFVMELVHGVPLTEYCDKNRLSTPARLRLFLSVCQAIQHAHQKGVIHRDIKPSNVMVTLHDGVPRPMVIDFGIAKATNQKLTEKTLFTHHAQMIGTPAYMSPEQAQMSPAGAGDVDTRSDVYSLGVLLYELLTGTTPFPAPELLSRSYGEMQRMIVEQDPPKPSTRLGTMSSEERSVVAQNRGLEISLLGALLRGDLDWIVMKAIEKDRTHRYETVNGLASDLLRYLQNEPVAARPPSTAYRLRKAIQRNRLAFLSGSVVGIGLVCGIAATSWLAWRAVRAERAQQHLRLAAEEARGIAERNEMTARNEAEKSAQAARFIQSMLTGLDLAASEGRDRQLVFDLLMRSLRRAEIELHNQPEVLITVVSEIGLCLDRLDLPNYAFETALRALVLAKAAWGEDAPRTAELMATAATLAIRDQRMGQAEALASQALAILTRAPSETQPGYLAALRALGQVYVETGKLAEAEPLFKRHGQLEDSILDSEDEARWINRWHWARALNGLGRFSEAEPLLREATAGYERLLGFSNRRGIACANSLCENLLRQHKTAEAELIARFWVDRLREANARHQEATRMQLLFARILLESGKSSEAGDELHQAFDTARARFGPAASLTGEIMQELDQWYRLQGREAEAADLARLVHERPSLHASGGNDFAAALVGLQTRLRLDSSDAHAAIQLAARQAWLGLVDDWRQTSRRIIEGLKPVQHPPTLERAAKCAVVLPGGDPDVLDQASVLARRALEGGQESVLLPFYQCTLGMVEYRRGHFGAAEARLAEVDAQSSFGCVASAFLYRAMIAFHEARPEDALRLLAAGEARLRPYPSDVSDPFASGGDHDDLIAWLAFQEARNMIDANSSALTAPEHAQQEP